MIGRIRALATSPSTYPLGTFWLVATIILPLTVSDTLPMNLSVGILTATATVLVFAAFKRDLDSVHLQHADLVCRVMQLTDALHRGGIPIPPIRSVGIHRRKK